MKAHWETAQYQSPLGPMALQGLDGLLHTARFADTRAEMPTPTVDISHACFAQAKQWLDEYFAGHNPTWRPPLQWDGTPFQVRVWQKLLDIPYGQTCTYRQLAIEAGNVHLARAIGGALHRNPLLIIVPCHRVVASDGTVGGYAAGTARKQALLQLERCPR
ncbi:MAG: methylated-DNA--[Bacteroidales bacterium]|nr:methylated-DNA--[protein]-cysteine S-methyltransferase [Bacteroidales bacterium]